MEEWSEEKSTDGQDWQEQLEPAWWTGMESWLETEAESGEGMSR